MANDPAYAHALHELRSEVVEFRAEMRECIRGMTRQCNEHDLMLSGDGNGHKGLLVRTDRLEQDRDRRDQHFWVMWTAVIGTIVGTVWAWFSGQKP